MPKTPVRDNIWLLSRLDHLWSNYFSDIPQTNKVYIRFGRYSRLRLGSIKLDRRVRSSLITITSVFKNPDIPTKVVDHTIAHELCHYAHGFSSLQPRLHKYPHHGGVIKKELQARKLDHLVEAYDMWLKEYREQLKSFYG